MMLPRERDLFLCSLVGIKIIDDYYNDIEKGDFVIDGNMRRRLTTLKTYFDNILKHYKEHMDFKDSDVTRILNKIKHTDFLLTSKRESEGQHIELTEAEKKLITLLEPTVYYMCSTKELSKKLDKVVVGYVAKLNGYWNSWAKYICEL